MLQGGDSLQNKTAANYYSNSLFDQSSPANQNGPLQFMLDDQSHREIYTEQYFAAWSSEAVFTISTGHSAQDQ
jgi:hypothetical protein